MGRTVSRLAGRTLRWQAPTGSSMCWMSPTTATQNVKPSSVLSPCLEWHLVQTGSYWLQLAAMAQLQCGKQRQYGKQRRPRKQPRLLLSFAARNQCLQSPLAQTGAYLAQPGLKAWGIFGTWKI